MAKQRADLTFRYNLKRGRHGWIRLTPAYSIKIVQRILNNHPQISRVLDPFSGTGTTGLVCAERGLNCDLIDINPFLVWFARAKTAYYPPACLQEAKGITLEICDTVKNGAATGDLWLPPIHNITRWWSQSRLQVLARIYHALNVGCPLSSPTKDLLLVSFCNLIISWSNAAFNHQSMSFKEDIGRQLTFFDEKQQILDHFADTVHKIAETAQTPLKGQVKVITADSRKIPSPSHQGYDGVITSPPYPNRMSYIRELRPYMYWLGYLETGREAGELDWQAIGGTWGIATSRLHDWQPDGHPVSYSGFDEIVAEISEHSLALGNYVYRYFEDILAHLESLYSVLLPGAQVFYIIGNSRFYETLVPVEKIYASLLETCGFVNIDIEIIRKRNSKKELYEFLVSATKPVAQPFSYNLQL